MIQLPLFFFLEELKNTRMAPLLSIFISAVIQQSQSFFLFLIFVLFDNLNPVNNPLVWKKFVTLK